MVLFSCYTPLQMLIVKKIIEHNGYSTGDVDIIYFQTKNAAMDAECLNIIDGMYRELFFVDKKQRKNFPRYIKNTFGDKHYQAIFVACPRKESVHYILSKISHDRVVTFDDGIGTWAEQLLELERPPYAWSEKVKRASHGFFYGRKFHDMYDVMDSSQTHYTVYNFPTGTDKQVVFVPLYDVKAHHDGHSEQTCDVIIGSPYGELVAHDDAKHHLIRQVQTLLKAGKAERDVYYLPHPREKDVQTLFGDYLYSAVNNGGSEKIILSLLEKYARVNLYGFCSSVQFNMLPYPRARVLFLDSHKLLPTRRPGHFSTKLHTELSCFDLDEIILSN